MGTFVYSSISVQILWQKQEEEGRGFKFAMRLLIFLPAISIPACASSSPAFLMMYSAYKLNKQGDNI